jgi:hypothetical protein
LYLELQVTYFFTEITHMNNVKLWLSTAVALLGLAVRQAAQAGPIVGSESLAGDNTAISGSTDVTTATSASWSVFFDTASKTGDFVSVGDLELIPFSSPLALHTGPGGWIIAGSAWGLFEETAVTSIVTGTNAITVYVDGFFTPGGDFPTDVTGNNATMIVQLNQDGGAGHEVTTTATLVSPAVPPPYPVPEPTSLAMFGTMGLTGLVAVGARRFRRGK